MGWLNIWDAVGGRWDDAHWEEERCVSLKVKPAGWVTLNPQHIMQTQRSFLQPRSDSTSLTLRLDCVRNFVCFWKVSHLDFSQRVGDVYCTIPQFNATKMPPNTVPYRSLGTEFWDSVPVPAVIGNAVPWKRSYKAIPFSTEWFAMIAAQMQIYVDFSFDCCSKSSDASGKIWLTDMESGANWETFEMKGARPNSRPTSSLLLYGGEFSLTKLLWRRHWSNGGISLYQRLILSFSLMLFLLYMRKFLLLGRFSFKIRYLWCDLIVCH